MAIGRGPVFDAEAGNVWSDVVDISGSTAVYLYYHISAAATINIKSALLNNQGVVDVPTNLVYNPATHVGAMDMTSFATAGYQTEVLLTNHAMDNIVFEVSGNTGTVTLYYIAT